MSKSNHHSFCLNLAIALATGLAVAGSSYADTILVPSQQPTIQAGINAADDGDEVVIADGTYTGAGNVNCNFQSKLITVRSASGDPTACIIDCEGAAGTRGFLFHAGETSAAVLSGITITGGTGDGAFGGAIRIDRGSPTIEHCRFVANLNNVNGRAIACLNGTSPTISDCFFQANQPPPLPMPQSALSVVYCQQPNGIPVITRCTFFDNEFSSAIQCSFGGTSSIQNCRFIGNGSIHNVEGGGIRCLASTSVVAVNCLFANNHARSGGAVSAVGIGAHVHLVNCTLGGNVAAPLVPDTEGGGGVYVRQGAQVTLRNSIVWNNLPTNLESSPTLPGTFDVKFSNVEDGPIGIGDLDLSPMFYSPNGPDTIPGTLDDDYSLRSVSPSIDSGSNAAVPAGIVTDIEGNPRFVDDPATIDIGAGTPPLVDMGCYEFQPNASATCPADLNGNGIVDGFDLAILLGAWGACP